MSNYNMITKKSWNEFRDSKLLWWVNRLLHTFGWAIVCTLETDGTISEVFPARVKFRGFSETDEEEGFKDLTNYLKEVVNELSEEIK